MKINWKLIVGVAIAGVIIAISLSIYPGKNSNIIDSGLFGRFERRHFVSMPNDADVGSEITFFIPSSNSNSPKMVSTTSDSSSGVFIELGSQAEKKFMNYLESKSCFSIVGAQFEKTGSRLIMTDAEQVAEVDESYCEKK